mmetsp:Transcript_904/g.2626  ORF Transcript_904/g.2626 Transcript_904/m.2626 type:complete len:119 (+) Transcript_904:45-401(+)
MPTIIKLGVPSMGDEEFDVVMGNSKIMAHLSSLGVETKHAQGLFELLDDDRSGTLKVDEVVDGLLEIQGEAKAAELLSLRRDVRILGRAVGQVRAALCGGAANSLPANAFKAEGSLRA